MSKPHIQLLSRRDCRQCEDAKGVIATVAEQGLCSWEMAKLDHDKTLLVRYGLDVPVLLVDGRVLFKHRVSPTDLQTSLASLMTETSP